ncbi:endonuclease [Propionibacteriaceae bacterium Y2011]|uniref:endonuclease n=1 Tax=Microlunatus sp. Y2014 TaxID=3418488 RepID=UPI003B4932B8
MNSSTAHPSTPEVEVNHRPRLTLLFGFVALAVVLVVATLPVTPVAYGAQAITVAEAIDDQHGGTASVTGYVVGQPVSESTVVTDDFPNDYALALADTAGETDTDKIVYVQLPSALRGEWGLHGNPDRLGEHVTVTGVLTAYFSHAGVKSTSTIAPADGEPSESPTSTPTSTPTSSPTSTPTSSPTSTPTSSPTSTPTVGEYYRAAEGKSGAELKTALHHIISEQTKLSYSDVWDALADTDEDPNNPDNVILLYSGRSQAKSAHGGGANDWNREHVWAKSHGDFGTRTGPGTDIHHLRPTDSTVNSTRSNLDFDNGGEPVNEAEQCSYDSDSFEPRDEVKGDVARMIFYMAVRYEGGDGFPDLEINDQVDNGSNPYMGRLSVLIQWHQQDPPSDFEKRRNQVIFESWQHNRNPFIDHPEWVASVFG